MPPFGLPRDPAQWVALLLAIAAIALASRIHRAPSRLFVAIAAITASLLSAAYVAIYLRGGPRIIDASAYFLEARAMSEGLLSFRLHEPATSVLGRFLVRSEHADGPHAAVIFPPGWPAILALGFLARAPMAVGPVVAAGIVIATADLASRLAKSLGGEHSPSIPTIAVALSVTCAALRYHTADTMSHGLAALCATSAITLVFRAIDAIAEGRSRRAAALAIACGFALGWLFATRPVSAAAIAVALAFVLIRDGAIPRSLSMPLAIPMLIGAIPGVLLFFAHQHAATGAWGMSSQRLYYELGDGPPGCFRYGFGAGIGCIGEHGDFVRARLADGYGAIAAAGTTLRRLKMHLVDPMNLEPLALLVPIGAFIARSSTRGRALGVAVIALILAYAPFYFDGNYPAGGGRFFCDVLPLEHALAAVAIASIASKKRLPERWAAGAVAISIAGFAFRAGFDHAQLRDRDGGRPLFEPAELARAGVTRGLVFIDTDHGFDLAYDPSPSSDLRFARLHGDAIDTIAWEAQGRPPAVRYRVSIPPNGGLARISIEPFEPDHSKVFEAESLWPPVAQDHGFAMVEWASGSCASAARWLALRAAGDRPSITLDLPAQALAGKPISPRVVAESGARGELTLTADGAEVFRWSFESPRNAGHTCLDLPPIRVPDRRTRLRLTLTRAGDPRKMIAIDAITAREND